MDTPHYQEDFLKVLKAVSNKRARFVIDTILEKGQCTTEDIANAGYEHPPRAARDVRELGIPLITKKVKGANGKTIGAYEFGDWDAHKASNKVSKTAGRSQLTKKLKTALAEKYGEMCNLYNEPYPLAELQPDHRIPYEIGGDPEDMMNIDYFQLVSRSANRQKSWACEHCKNWKDKDINVCKNCFWASPENYTHIAGIPERLVSIIFKGKEIDLYTKINKEAICEGLSIQDYIKKVLKEKSG